MPQLGIGKLHIYRVWTNAAKCGNPNFDRPFLTNLRLGTPDLSIYFLPTNFSFPGPSSPPQTVMVETVESTWITLRWTPPPPQHHNAPLTHYRIKYKWTTSQGTGDNITVPASQLSANITGLHPYYEYEIGVAAANVAGEGSYSTVIKRTTLQAGMIGSAITSLLTAKSCKRPSPFEY